MVRRDQAARPLASLGLLLDLAFGIVNLLVFVFISRLVHQSAAQEVRASGSYFSYAAVGLAFLLVVQAACVGVARQVREEQQSGTLELLAAAPVGLPTLALGFTGFPFLFAVVRAAAYLVIAGFLGLDVAHANWWGVAVVLLASAGAMAAIGIALAAAAVTFVRGELLSRVTVIGLGFLSGTYFPVRLLAPPLHDLAAVLPTRMALDGLRAALRGSSWLPFAGELLAFSAVALPIAVMLFAGAIRLAARRGTLTRA